MAGPRKPSPLLSSSLSLAPSSASVVPGSHCPLKTLPLQAQAERPLFPSAVSRREDAAIGHVITEPAATLTMMVSRSCAIWGY